MQPADFTFDGFLWVLVRFVYQIKFDIASRSSPIERWFRILLIHN